MDSTSTHEKVFSPLSKSKLYRLMTDFYVEAGVNAWVDHVVPHYISSNAKLAQSYASVIVSGMWDLHHQGQLNREEPFVVLELGAGSGALAWLLGQALMRILNERSNLALPPVLYIVSDVAQSNLNAMRDDISGFSEWFDVLEGSSVASLSENMDRLSIDWALVDLTGDCSQIFLQSSGITLQQGTLSNPMFLVGTYLLDSIPQDAFRCVGGELFAQWCSFEAHTRPGLAQTALFEAETASDGNTESSSEGSAASPLGPQGFKRSAEVDLQWTDHPISTAGIDEHMMMPEYALHNEDSRTIIATMLHWYQQYFLHDSAEYTQDPVAAAGAGNRVRGGSVDTDDSLDSTGAPLNRERSDTHHSDHSGESSEGNAASLGGGGSTFRGASSGSPPPRRLLGTSRSSAKSAGRSESQRSTAVPTSICSVSSVELQGTLLQQLTPAAAIGACSTTDGSAEHTRESPTKTGNNAMQDSQSDADSDGSGGGSPRGSRGGSGSSTFRSHSSDSRSSDSDSDDSTVAGTVSAAFTLPTCAVCCLEQLRGLSRGATLCIWGDKGNNSPTSYVGQSSPHVSLHGSFSLMVNFHALTLYAELCGGFTLLPGRAEMSLTSCVMVLPPHPSTPLQGGGMGPASAGGVVGGTEGGAAGVKVLPSVTHRAGVQYDGDSDSDEGGDSAAALLGQISLHNPETAAGWALLTERLAQHHPSAPSKPWAHARSAARAWPALASTVRSVLGVFSPDDFFYIQEDLTKRGPPQSLRQCLALCNLAAWDPYVVQACMPLLQQRLASGRYTLKHDFLLGIRRTWANWYRVLASNKCDLPYDIGLLWMALGDMVRAEAFFTASLRYVGPHHATHYQIARCRAQGKRDMPGAVEALQASLTLLPSYDEASNFLQYLLRYQVAAAHAEKLGLKAVYIGDDSESNTSSASPEGGGGGGQAGHAASASYEMSVGGQQLRF